MEVLSDIGDKLLTVKIGEDKIMKFPYSFLRDACDSNFHPSTGQRVNSMRRNILKSRPKSITVIKEENPSEPNESILEIEWKVNKNKPKKAFGSIVEDPFNIKYGKYE